MRYSTSSIAACAYVALAATLTVLPTAATAAVASFQEGVNGYTGTQDTWITEFEGVRGADPTLLWDGPTGPDSVNPLLRFDNIFGLNPGHVPPGSTIISAMLTLHNAGNFGDAANVHRMLIPWTEADTYDTLGGGVLLNDIEAIATPDTTTSSGHSTPIFADVTLSVQHWAAGAANYGWIFDELTIDGVLVHSSEAATPTPADRPLLVIEFEPVPEPPAHVIMLLACLAMLSFGWRPTPASNLTRWASRPPTRSTENEKGDMTLAR